MPTRSSRDQSDWVVPLDRTSSRILQISRLFPRFSISVTLWPSRPPEFDFNDALIAGHWLCTKMGRIPGALGEGAHAMFPILVVRAAKYCNSSRQACARFRSLGLESLEARCVL